MKRINDKEYSLLRMLSRRKYVSERMLHNMEFSRAMGRLKRDKLVKSGKKKHFLYGQQTVWELSRKGREVFKELHHAKETLKLISLVKDHLDGKKVLLPPQPMTLSGLNHRMF